MGNISKGLINLGFFFQKQTHSQKKGKEILTQMHKLVYQHKGTNKHTQKGSYKKKGLFKRKRYYKVYTLD